MGKFRMIVINESDTTDKKALNLGGKYSHVFKLHWVVKPT